MTYTTKTTYTCDRCGATQMSLPDSWGKVEIGRIGHMQYATMGHLCNVCLDHIGFRPEKGRE